MNHIPWLLPILFLLKYLHPSSNSELSSSASCDIFLHLDVQISYTKGDIPLQGLFLGHNDTLTAGHVGETW